VGLGGGVGWHGGVSRRAAPTGSGRWCSIGIGQDGGAAGIPQRREGDGGHEGVQRDDWLLARRGSLPLVSARQLLPQVSLSGLCESFSAGYA